MEGVVVPFVAAVVIGLLLGLAPLPVPEVEESLDCLRDPLRDCEGVREGVGEGGAGRDEESAALDEAEEVEEVRAMDVAPATLEGVGVARPEPKDSEEAFAETALLAVGMVSMSADELDDGKAEFG